MPPAFTEAASPGSSLVICGDSVDEAENVFKLYVNILSKKKCSFLSKMAGHSFDSCSRQEGDL